MIRTYTDQIWNFFVWGWENLALAAHPNHYTVNLWGSHPDDGNDDCYTGEHFATRDEAIKEFDRIAGGGSVCAYAAGFAWVEIVGPDTLIRKRNPDQRAVRRAQRELERDNDEWRRERATQAGMAFGCDGYNDEMGW